LNLRISVKAAVGASISWFLSTLNVVIAQAEEEGPLELTVIELRERERVRGVEEEEVGVVRGCWVVMVMEGGGEERWAALLTCSHGGIIRRRKRPRKRSS
jgi:hypothetical protein